MKALRSAFELVLQTKTASDCTCIPCQHFLDNQKVKAYAPQCSRLVGQTSIGSQSTKYFLKIAFIAFLFDAHHKRDSVKKNLQVC